MYDTTHDSQSRDPVSKTIDAVSKFGQCRFPSRFPSSLTSKMSIPARDVLLFIELASHYIKETFTIS